MFPNVRLIIVAISASMLAIVCAMSLFLGMFAAFSVAHEPFATLQSTKPPLQIAFGGESLAPVVDGRTSPFGIRFQLKAPQAPNGPVIVAVPAALDHAAPAETGAEAPSNPAANAQVNAQSSSQPRSQSMAATPEDDATVQTSLRDAPAAAPAAAAPSAEVKPNPAKPDEASKDDSTGTITAPVSEPPAVAGAPHHIAPEIKIVAREADNPASVTTSPAPTLARKAIKRRRLAVHLHQSHHFRRPRIYSIATNPASGYVQPNAYIQPGGAAQIGMTGYSQPSANAPPGGFIQQGFQFTPTAIKPKTVRLRHAAGNPAKNSASP
jgi:hypothetical protein